MKRALYLLFFMVLVAEGPRTYGGYWQLPFGLVHSLLFEWKPLIAPFVDIFTLLLIAAATPLRLQRDPIARAMQMSTLCLGLWSVLGVAYGGSAYQIQFQLHTLLASFLFAIACRRVLTSPDDYLGLGKVFVYAALYRALMCIAFYALVLRPNVMAEPPEYCTSHDDTVLFVTALIMMWLHIGTAPTPLLSRSRALLFSAIIMAGIQFNNRRLAWVSLLGAVAMLYIVLPPSAMRRTIKRVVFRTLPWIALYVVVGWGRPESVFKPLRSLSSVTDVQDASTRSRDAENAGLIFSLMPSPVTGIGFGREYTEVDTSLSARIFLQYRYQPHNSVLGLLAFTGFLGFAGIWMVWPVCAYMASRAVLHARDPTVHCFGLAIVTQLVVCLNQMWGDMGFFSSTTMFTAATAFACASHLLSFEPRLADDPATHTVVREDTAHQTI